MTSVVPEPPAALAPQAATEAAKAPQPASAQPAAPSATAFDAHYIRKAIVLVEEAILKKTLDAKSPTSILNYIYNILSAVDKDVVHQKELVIAVVTKICAGIDGIAGTADDLLPPSTVTMLTAVIQNDLVGEIINFAQPILRTCFTCLNNKVKGE